MPVNYASPLIVKRLVDEIKGMENLQRKQISLKQYEIFMDRLEVFVKDYLSKFYNEADVDSLPVISSINLARRIVKQEAGVYRHAPERIFTGLTPAQVEIMEQIYEDMEINAMLQKSNQYYKLQGQNNIQIIPVDGKLKIRVLMNHHFDVVPKSSSPETADAYILSGYDKLIVLPTPTEGTDGTNEMIADPNDYQATLKTYVLWSDEFNYLFDENGNVLGGVTPNPIGIMPFVDISPAKDFEFFVRLGSSVTEFTIQFNAALTDMSQIVRMQGFAQAYMIAEQASMPTSMKIGPMIAVKMALNPDNPGVRPEFGFAQPNADIAGSLQYLESLVALFLSSRGLDPKIVSAKGESAKFNSGLERLLSMLEQFDASREDFTTYMNAEKKIFEIVKAYLNTYSGTEILQYNIGIIPDSAGVEVKFHSPEMIKTDADKLGLIEKRMDLGLISQIEAISQDRGVDESQALEYKQKMIDEPQLIASMSEKSLSSNKKDVLNGAQVTALVDVMSKVTSKVISPDAAANVIQVAFGLDKETADRIVNSSAKFSPEYIPGDIKPADIDSKTAENIEA